MKIVFDGLIYSLQDQGGISRYFDELINGLSEKQDCEVTVLMRKDKVDKIFKNNVKVQIINSTIYSGNKILKYISIFKDRYITNQYLKKNNFPGSIFHYTYYTHYKNLKAKSVLTVYDMIHEKFPTLFNGFFNNIYLTNKKTAIKKAGTIISISEQTKKDILDAYKILPNKINTIYLGVNRNFRALDKNGKEVFVNKHKITKPFLTFVGNRFLYKNFDFLLKTYAAWEKNSSINLYCIGGGEFMEIEKKLINNLGLGEKIKLFPYVSEEELIFFYNCSTALVFPSQYEGFGLPLLEAMACGTKVLASDISIFHEIGGNIPIYFNPVDKESLTKALNQSLTSDETRLESGLGWVKKYNWENTVLETFKIYNKIV